VITAPDCSGDHRGPENLMKGHDGHPLGLQFGRSSGAKVGVPRNGVNVKSFAGSLHL
jgi:hypothetical protein